MFTSYRKYDANKYHNIHSLTNVKSRNKSKVMPKSDNRGMTTIFEDFFEFSSKHTTTATGLNCLVSNLMCLDVNFPVSISVQ